MRIRELIVEGPGALAEPLRYAFGPGHLAVRPDDPLLAYLSCLLYGGPAPAGWEGKLTAHFEEQGGERSFELRVGPMEIVDPLVPDGAFWLLAKNPRPIRLSEAEREELRGLLPRLRTELESQEEIERLDAEVRGLAHDLSTIDAQLEERDRARAARDAAEKKAAAFLEVEVPPEIEERIQAYEQARERQREKVERLRAELEKVSRLEKESQVDVWRDRRLWASAAAGLLFFTLALMTPWKGLAILSIPAFGVTSALLLAAISALQQREDAGRRRAFLHDRLAEAEKAQATGFADLEALLRATESASIDELRAWLRRAAGAEEEARLAGEMAEAIESRQEIRTADERRAKVAAAIEKGEAKLASLAAGAFRSPGEIRQEMAEIERKLEGGEGAQDLSPPFLEAACRSLGCDRAELLQTVGKRASQLLASLTDERWKSVGWGATGGMALKGAAGVVRFADLEHEDREAARAALLFAAAELSVGGASGVLLLDAPFDEVEAELQVRLARALRWLGERGVQIVHRTSIEAFRRTATVLEAA